MQFLAVVRRLTESFSQADFDALLDDEAEGVRRLYAQGVVREAWSRDDVLGACLVMEADSREHAESELMTLPLFVHKMVDYQLIPLRGYRGFGPRPS
ncbi:MAG TPA: muconolactone Delta-isomerase family protein [Candidatus Aquilonibacter sp.]|nr:muconolactone Delta-isomerase family protein [Candidatus Aquilonibacter sp.]